MKKKILLCAMILLSLALAAFAGPFGLEMGMTLEEVAKACGGKRPEHIGDHRYLIEPVKKHPSFSTYIAWISPAEGLNYIRANSEKIYSNNTGDQVKNQFYRVENALSKSYGEPVLIDRVSKDSLYKKESFWMHTLGTGERELCASWFPKNNDIIFIALWALAENSYSSTAIISIVYEFQNHEKAQAELDDVL